MCFEKKKKSLEKEASRVQQATSLHIRTERETLASDIQELKQFEEKLTQIDRSNEEFQNILKSLASEYQKQQRNSERELVEAENEYKRNIESVYSEAADFEKSQDQAYKVRAPHSPKTTYASH